MMGKKRVAVYVFYDKAGVVDSYVIRMLQELHKVCERLVVVCNGLLNDEGKEAVSNLTSDIVIRKNIGFDAWGYKAGLEYIGWDNIEQYDSVILMNDSVFGPIYPFQAMFDEMDSKNLDFWGITKHGQIPDETGYAKGGIYPEHIQSYFYTFNKKMLSHPEFENYWTTLRKFKSWKEVVSHFETQFTKHFAEQGLTWDVYINTDKEFSDYSDVSQILQMAYELVKDYKCPVLKRKSFSIKYGNFFAFTIGDSTRKAFKYIKEETAYDTEMIWEHILRTMSLRNLTDNLQLNYVLPRDYVRKAEEPSPCFPKIAVFAHITYEDRIAFLKKYIDAVAEIADIYITTLTEQTREAILERFSHITQKKLNVIVLPKNSKGRDVGALWVALRPYMTHYDYICFIHNKKSAQDKPLTIGRGFAERCLENTLASKEYVINIINTFAENPRLGMMFPPPVIHGPYKAIISNLWGGNFENTKDLAKKLNINAPIDDISDPIFPAGGMFWFRTKALKKIIEFDWKYEDFQDEPLPVDGTLGHAFERVYCFAAQGEGYYSAWVLNDYFVSTEITSLNHILASAQLSGWGLYKYQLVQFLKKSPKIYGFLRKIYRLLKKALGIKSSEEVGANRTEQSPFV